MALVDPNSLTPAAIDSAKQIETTSPLQNADRITAVLMFHFEQKDQPPISIDARYNSLLIPRTEPYVRRVPVSEKWAPSPKTVVRPNKTDSQSKRGRVV